jgi:UDPglucose--hexose-1-phosphate uridylyltransferase
MMALRNNRTSETYPEGIFHIHENNEAIKKENIGLIEVMGLGVLPGRLALELPYVEEVLKGQAPINQLSLPMQTWTESIKAKQPQEISLNWVQEEAMRTFVRGLEDCAVFPHNEEGLKAFTLFIQEATQ